MRKRKAHGTVNSGPQVGGQLDEFVTFVDENELVCVVCNKNFASMANKSQHVCKGARLPRDMLSTAMRFAYKMIEDGAVGFIDTSMVCVLENDEEIANAFLLANVDDYSAVSFAKGWALRAGYGKIYGAKYIDKYKADIDELYSRGNIDQRHKMGPGRMLECLRVKYPNKLDLPSETEIRQRITSLVAKYKKHGTIYLKRGIQEPFKGILMNIVISSRYQVKPQQALEFFRLKITEQNLTDHEDKPDNKHVKSFISALKSKHKKNLEADLSYTDVIH